MEPNMSMSQCIEPYNVARRGFTIVEVVVVAVIVLILSAAAIPMYGGFLKGARQDAVDGLAETAAAAANSYWLKTGGVPTITGPNTAPLNLYYDDKKHAVSIRGDSLVAEDIKYKVRKAVYYK
jgi:prepilin-type N-terminal cleavage/methylation domain-containing protein